MHFTAEGYQQGFDVRKDDSCRSRLGKDSAERFSVSGVHAVMLAKCASKHKRGDDEAVEAGGGVELGVYSIGWIL